MSTDNQINVINLVEKAANQECNHTHHIYIDICDDLVAGTLLDKILCLFSPDTEGSLEIKTFKDGYYWLVKGREDWYEEIRISAKQYDRAIKILKDKGFVEIAIYKYNGTPMIHIRPILENIQIAEADWKIKKGNEIIETLSSQLRNL